MENTGDKRPITKYTLLLWSYWKIEMAFSPGGFWGSCLFIWVLGIEPRPVEWEASLIGKSPALGILGKCFTAEPLGSLRSDLAFSGSCIGFSLCLEESLLQGILLPPTPSGCLLRRPSTPPCATKPFVCFSLFSLADSGFVWPASFGFMRQVFNL